MTVTRLWGSAVYRPTPRLPSMFSECAECTGEMQEVFQMSGVRGQVSVGNLDGREFEQEVRWRLISVMPLYS